MAHLEFVVDKYGNRKSVSIDPNSSEPYTIFGDVWLHLGFSERVESSSMPASLGGSSIQPYPQGIQIKLDANTKEVALPASLKSVLGHTLPHDYLLRFEYLSDKPAHPTLLSLYLIEYPLLSLDVAGTFSVMLGETFVIKQNWPLEREEVEARVYKALTGARYESQWFDEESLAITISEAKQRSYKLVVDGMQDKYGYIHESPFVYEINIVHQMFVKEINLATKAEITTPLPISVDGATPRVDEGLRLYRAYQLFDGGDPYPIYQRFSFDISSRSLVGLPSNEVSEPIWYALRLMRRFIPEGVVTSHVGLAPDNTGGAAIYYNWDEKVSFLLVADFEQNHFETRKLVSSLKSDGSGRPPEPIVWAYDGKSLAYASADQNESFGLYLYDLQSGAEKRILNGWARPIAVGPNNLMLCWYGGTDYYVIDASGKHNKLPLAEGNVDFVTWVDQERLLLNVVNVDKPQFHVYNIITKSYEFSAPGLAFDYDTSTQTIYVLDAAK